MSKPFLLAQLSDPHIGADWAGGDPAAGLAAAVEAVRRLSVRPEAVLVSGDLADHAADDEYKQVRELLSPLQLPVYVLPGNHDDRRALHGNFDVPSASGEPVQYSVDLGRLRLIVVDTTRPGRDDGALDASRLAWLHSELRAARRLPTLIAMHHPPFLTGVQGWDKYGLAAPGRQALEGVVRRHRQVRGLVAGHVHSVITAELAGRPVMTIPSTYVQARPNFASGEVDWVHDPIGFAIHAMLDGELTSHVQVLGSHSKGG